MTGLARNVGRREHAHKMSTLEGDVEKAFSDLAIRFIG